MTTDAIGFRLGVSGQAEVVGAMGAAERAMGRVSEAHERMGSTAASAANLVRNLIGALGVGISVKGAIDAADAVTNLHNQLKLATGSTSAAAAAYERLFAIAQSSRTSFTDLGATFASIARASSSLGLSQERLLTVTEAIGNAMTVSGGSAESMKDALVQLSQGLGSGVLRGDELNSVIEQTPRLAQALADGLGVSRGELKNLGEQGALTAEKVIGALEKSAPQLAKEVQGATLTVGQAFTLLSNSATKFVGEADKASGASGTLAGAMKSLSGAIDSVGKTITEHEAAFKIIGGTLAGATALAGVGMLADKLKTIAISIGSIGAALAANPVVLTLLGIGAVVGGTSAASAAIDRTAAGIRGSIATLQQANAEMEAQAQRAEAAGRAAGAANIRATNAPQIEANKRRILELQQQLAQAQYGNGAGAGRGNAEYEAYLANMAAETAAAKGLAEVKAKLLGLDSDYAANIEKIITARQRGLLGDKEYTALLAEMQEQALKATGGVDAVANGIAAQQASSLEAVKRQLDDVERKRVTGELNERQAIDERMRLDIAALGIKRQALQAQAAATTSEADAAKLGQQAAEIDAQILTRRRAGENEVLKLQRQQLTAANAVYEAQRQEDDDARRDTWDKDAAAMVRIEQSLYAYNRELQDASLLSQAALSVLGDATVARAFEVEQLRAALALRERIAEIDATSGPTIDEEWRERQRQRARLAAGQAVANAQGAAVADFVGKDMGLAVADGFDKASQSLAAFARTFGTLLSMQVDYAAARKAAGEDAVKIAAVEEKNLRNQMAGYGTLAGAAKGFFSEGSRGYRAMQAAEKVFRAFELANALKNAAVQLGLIGSLTTARVASDQTLATSAATSATVQVAAATTVGQANAVAAVANQGNGDPYSAFFRIAAMAAIMAALGYSTGALGGGAPTADPGNSGAGTVFGDSTAQSESIANALELLGEVDTKTMQYSAQMAASLSNIEANIGGLTNLLVRSGAIDAATAGIDTSTKTTGAGKLEAAVARAWAGVLTFGLSELLGLGKVIDGIVGKVFNAKTSITGQGIYADPQSLGAILENGFDATYYADTYTRKKFAGITYSRSTGTLYTEANAELEQQFGLIFEGFSDALEAAAGPLGAALSDVEQRLLGFTVSIGKINLQGLTGSEIQEKLSAVFGAAGDNIAAAALPGLERYQAVGEGYLETVVRVATSTETVRETLRALGGTVFDLGAAGTAASMALVDAFGDLDAFTSQTQAYYEAYYTDAERAAVTTRQLTEALARLGIDALPSSRDAYRDLVDAQDLTTDSGRSTYAALVGLSSLFADLTDAIESAGARVRDEINRLRGVTDTDTVEGLAALQARFAIASAQAKAGDTTALESLPELSRAIETAATATASSALEVARIRAGLASSLEDMLGLAVPAFANGGDHAGGLAWVGESGPELVNLPPSRVYTARESSQLMRASGASDDESKQLLRQVLAELQAQREEGRIGTATLAHHANRTATVLERVIPDGDALAVRTAES